MSSWIVQETSIKKIILITANLSGFKAFGGHLSKLNRAVIREPH